MRHDRNFKELRADMSGVLFVGVLLVMVLITNETFRVLSTTRSSVEAVLGTPGTSGMK